MYYQYKISCFSNTNFYIAPGKRYNYITVNGETSSDFRGLDKGTTYYFSIEALGKTGRSPMGKEVEVRWR